MLILRWIKHRIKYLDWVNNGFLNKPLSCIQTNDVIPSDIGIVKVDILLKQ